MSYSPMKMEERPNFLRPAFCEFYSMGTELDATALADLRKKTEAAGYACR
jgi:hypothetical protein